MIVLALDTSTPVTVVGLCALENGAVRTLASIERPPPEKAGELLPGLVDQVCKDAGKSLGEIEAIVAGVGPGSFTGLRVGLACAKGLAYARRLPLVGASTLRSVARAAFAKDPAHTGPIIASIEARRGELFLAGYEHQGAEWIERLAPTVQLAAQVAATISALDGARLIGPGAHANRAALLAAGVTEAQLASAQLVSAPSANALVEEAAPALATARFDLAALFAIAPDYLAQSGPEKALAEGRVGKLTPGA